MAILIVVFIALGCFFFGKVFERVFKSLIHEKIEDAVEDAISRYKSVGDDENIELGARV